MKPVLRPFFHAKLRQIPPFSDHLLPKGDRMWQTIGGFPDPYFEKVSSPVTRVKTDFGAPPGGSEGSGQSAVGSRRLMAES
jgi:hypothetical protein